MQQIILCPWAFITAAFTVQTIFRFCHGFSCSCSARFWANLQKTAASLNGRISAVQSCLPLWAETACGSTLRTRLSFMLFCMHFSILQYFSAQYKPPESSVFTAFYYDEQDVLFLCNFSYCIDIFYYE